MGIFRQFPYSNFHDLNTGWIIRKMMELNETMDQFIVDWGKEVVEEVDKWLTEHPEYTTTVMDDSLTVEKFTAELKLLTVKDYVTPDMFGAAGDGLTDDKDALIECFNQGLPVYIPDKTYCTSESLSYTGNMIFGSGTIKTTAPIEKVLNCSSDTIVIDGIKVDCNNMSSTGIYCAGQIYVEIKHCEVFDTNNDLFATNVGCYGAYAVNYKIVNIHDNYIHNINRTVTDPYTISSVGIVARTNYYANVSHNNIEAVHCSNETTDCDGIYVTFASGGHDSATNTAEIIGNVIKDSTGRFVKTQCHNAIINDNDCRLVNSAGSLFFKAFDFQTGGGELANNYVDVGNKLSSSSKLVHIDFTSYLDRVITIKNNMFRLASVIAYFVDCEGTGAGGKIIIDGNNIVSTTTVNYVVRCVPSATAALEIIIKDNTFPIYRVINSGSGAGFENTYLRILNNRNTAGTVFVFSAAVNINNIVIRDNVGISNVLTNITANFTNMSIFDFIYSGSAAIANAPAAISSATHVYVKSLGVKLMQYYNYADSDQAIITF